MRLKVKRQGEQWNTEDVWNGGTQALKPYFNDFVTYEDSIYGFDGTIFCCVDLETGKRRWKGGRYGAGQVLLLADQGVLVVITEKGEAVLVAANPDEHEELGKFQAIEGKTWNHPTVVKHRLYVRNAEEMACYELKPL
jgi:outer membrane protein assembly factor BamB